MRSCEEDRLFFFPHSFIGWGINLFYMLMIL